MGLGRAGAALADAGAQRDSYLLAAAIARREGWPNRLAEAAIGFAGADAGSGPGRAEERRAVTLMDEALEGLPADAIAERAVLLAVRVLHAVVRDRDEEARRLTAAAGLAADSADPTAVAAGAVARAWSQLGGGPSAGAVRVAGETVDGVDRPEARRLLRQCTLPLMALPALQGGDREAYEHLRRRLRPPGTSPASHAGRYLTTWDTAVALADGRFGEVERRAGTDRDRPPWPMWTATALVHAAIAAAERGSHAGLVPALERSLAVDPDAVTLRTALALIHAADGDRARATEHIAMLRRRRPSGLDRLGWGAPLALRHLAETAVLLGDRALAADLLPVLDGHAGTMLVSFAGVTVDGAADRAIGQVLLALDRPGEAVDRLDAAHDLERRFAADALVTRTAYWRARALRARGAPGDHVRAETIRSSAAAGARHLGMARLERDLDDLASPPCRSRWAG